MADQTVRVAQASQPTFAGVRVGVVLVGLKAGVPTTRLLLRSDDQADRRDLAEGDSVDLFGQGTLTVLGVHPREHPDERDYVTITFTEPTHD